MHNDRDTKIVLSWIVRPYTHIVTTKQRHPISKRTPRKEEKDKKHQHMQQRAAQQLNSCLDNKNTFDIGSHAIRWHEYTQLNAITNFNALNVVIYIFCIIIKWLLDSSHFNKKKKSKPIRLYVDNGASNIPEQHQPIGYDVAKGKSIPETLCKHNFCHWFIGSDATKMFRQRWNWSTQIFFRAYFIGCAIYQQPPLPFLEMASKV